MKTVPGLASFTSKIWGWYTSIATLIQNPIRYLIGNLTSFITGSIEDITEYHSAQLVVDQMISGVIIQSSGVLREWSIFAKAYKPSKRFSRPNLMYIINYNKDRIFNPCSEIASPLLLPESPTLKDPNLGFKRGQAKGYNKRTRKIK